MRLPFLAQDLDLHGQLTDPVLAWSSCRVSGSYEICWSDDGRLLYVASEKNRAPVDLTLIVPPHLLRS